ncbi:MAG TPA: DNA alkylation repair protein [Bacteroidetes bacterium]|nr:DNA alkylation repair protein [Bacteroidota bacterium]
MRADEVIERLRSLGNRKNVEGMARYGIASAKAFGVTAPEIRRLAKGIGRDQELSLALWRTGYLEARAVASLIGDPDRVTEDQMDRWVEDFDSWAVCDACCGILFDKTPFAYRKAAAWAKRDEEFVKRAGYVMMAELAVHDKVAGDARFIKFFPLIKKGSVDGRNFVKKAVNWALRQIGKRNVTLHPLAVRLAEDIRSLDSSSAKWIAADALRELNSASVRRRLKKRM